MNPAMNPLSYPSCNIRRSENVSRAVSLRIRCSCGHSKISDSALPPACFLDFTNVAVFKASLITAHQLAGHGAEERIRRAKQSRCDVCDSNYNLLPITNVWVVDANFPEQGIISFVMWSSWTRRMRRVCWCRFGKRRRANGCASLLRAQA
jgi:hypothetical protein